MFPLFVIGLVAFGLFKLAGGTATVSASLPSSVAVLTGTPPPWPLAAMQALGNGRHYFFTMPLTKAADVGALTTALTLLGFTEVGVFPTGASLALAPSPHPPEWQVAQKIVCIGCGRWGGQAGAPLDFTALVPLGADPQSKVALYIATEDWLALNAQH